MNHPYGPSGCGVGNPRYCGQQPNYLLPQDWSRTGGSGTAITAGVLGIVLGVFCIGRAVIVLVVLKGLTAVQDMSNMAIDFASTDGKPQQHVHIDTTPYYVGATIGILVAALFITGSAMLLNRRTGRRTLLTVVAGLALLAGTSRHRAGVRGPNRHRIQRFHRRADRGRDVVPLHRTMVFRLRRAEIVCCSVSFG